MIRYFIYYVVYMYIFRLFSLICYNKVLSTVPCAIQLVFVSYLFYIQQYVYINLKQIICPSTLNPMVTINLFCISGCLSCFVYKLICIIVFAFLCSYSSIWTFPGKGSKWNYSCQPIPQPQQCRIQAVPVTYTIAQGSAGSTTH